MSDRDLIARAIHDRCGRRNWDDLEDQDHAVYRADADAVLAALGATGDDVLVALPREYVERGALTPTPTFGPACRAALTRGRREPVTVTLDPDDAAKVAARLRSEAGGGWDFSHRVADALDAALGGES